MQEYEYAQEQEGSTEQAYLSLYGDINLDKADEIGFKVLEQILSIHELQGLGQLDIRIEILK